MQEIKTTVHLTSGSRLTEGESRLYYKESTVFMWTKPRKWNGTSKHEFYLSEWITQETRIGAIVDATKTK